MNKSLKVVLIIVISYLMHYTTNKLYFLDIKVLLDSYLHEISVSHFLAYLITLTPLFVGVGILHNFKRYFENLGFSGSILKGAAFAFLCTFPMLIGYSLFFEFNMEIAMAHIIKGAVIAAFIEELFFRGILFGQIFRFTNIGFIPAIVLSALLFASGHLYQSQDITTMFGIFLTTFMGAVLFAWLYVEWNYNLWVSIFLHLFMNLFWMLFSASDNALGGTYANIFRIITIALTIGLTVFYKIRKGMGFEINNNTLFIKSDNTNH